MWKKKHAVGRLQLSDKGWQFSLYTSYSNHFVDLLTLLISQKTLQLLYLNKILDIQRRGRVLFYFSVEGIRILQNGGRQCGKVERITVRLGVKRVTEPNRTEPADCTGRSLRKFPIVAVPGFTSVTGPNQRKRYLLLILSLFLFILLD